MGASFGYVYAAAVIHWEEDVGGLVEVGESGFEAQRVFGVHEQEGHRRAKEDDVRFRVVAQLLVLEVLLPERDRIVRQPVVAYALYLPYG